MATVSHRALANENSRNQKTEAAGKGVMVKGKAGGLAPRAGTGGRRALAEVGNLVEASNAAAAARLKNMPATKPGVVTRMAARKAAAAQTQQATVQEAGAKAGGDLPMGNARDAATMASATVPTAVTASAAVANASAAVAGNAAGDSAMHYLAVDACCAAVAAAVNAVTGGQHQPAHNHTHSHKIHEVDDEDDEEEDEEEEDEEEESEGEESGDVVATGACAGPQANAQKAPAPGATGAWDHGLACRADKAISTSALLLAFSEEASGSQAGAADMEASDIKEEVVELDIDWEDRGNPQAVTEYVEDIYAFYRNTERDGMVPRDYMSKQGDINENMRAILLDWLIEVHLKFKLMPETLYLTSNLIDRYLAITPVTRRNLQLVGVTAMLVASKYEEIWAPEVKDFVYISDNAYNRDQILALEKHMLNSLRFNLTVPTPYVFAVRFIKAAAACRGGSPTQNAEADKQTFTLVWYLLELCLPEYCMLQFSPSMLAASAVYTALATSAEAKRTAPAEASITALTLNSASSSSTAGSPSTPAGGSQPLGSQVWAPVLVRHTGYTIQDLHPCASLMVAMHQRSGTGSLKAVHKKYSSPRFGAVAKIIPPCPSPNTLLHTPPASQEAASTTTTVSSASMLLA